MKKAKTKDLKDNLSRYLGYVRRGGTVRVYDRDEPVAELVPIGARAADAAEGSQGSSGELAVITARLEREGVLRRGTGKLPDDFFTRRLPKAKKSVVEALLEEREEGR